jgi:hypothetical protein
MDSREDTARTPSSPPHEPRGEGASTPRADTAALAEALQSGLAAGLGEGRALLVLLGRELGLSVALIARAVLLGLVALAAGAIAIGLAAALLVALGLTLGLGWPAALAGAAALMLILGLLCRARAAQLLSEARMPATRRRLGALLQPQAASATPREGPA